MTPNNFTEEDKRKFVEFLNLMAERFCADPSKPWKAKDSIEHFKLLAHMQQVLIPKIDAHILEIKAVVEPDEQAENEEA